jgi:tetratricopeptide (TPR) repeat protein
MTKTDWRVERFAWLGAALMLGLGMLRADPLLLMAADQIGPLSAASEPEIVVDGTLDELDRRVERLIGELGSDQFVRRERAQAELERLGVAAFDAIREAQLHDDIEVSLRARYLVRRLQVRWFDEHDPPEVRRVMRDYGEQTVAERRARMDRLAGLDEGQGAAALCRLVRFESELTLAKHAALLVLRQDLPVDSAARAERGRRLLEAISLSRNPAAVWVKTHARSLFVSEQDDSVWDGLLDREEQTLVQFPERTSSEIVIDLMRWRAERLFDQQRVDEAVPLAMRTLDLVPAKRDQLLSAVDWLIRFQVWDGAEELADRHPEAFGDSILLRYRLAEVQLTRGDSELAEATAEEAMKHRAEQFEERLEAAVALQERGLFPWAEREFRSVIENAPVGSNHEFEARFSLAEMLHDHLKDLAAAKVYQEVADRMEADPDYAKRFRDHRRGDPDIMRARMHFFYSEHYATEDRAKQREQLELGLKIYPREIDLLIAAYRFPEGDESWRTMIRQLLEDAVGTYREQIRQYSDLLQGMSGRAQEKEVRRYVAVLNNQFAWLVANTEGDFDEALRCSRLSLEYMPNSAGYLDTLGRCYYALGDYENAVKYQARAVALEPHSGQIRRQFELFEQALAAETKQAGH